MSKDQYSICPFDKNHEILTFRMPGHLLKCRKNYKGPPLETCMYNATHLVPKGTMKEHLAVCKDGHIFNEPTYIELVKQSQKYNQEDWN